MIEGGLNRAESICLPFALKGKRRISISFPLRKGILCLGDLLLLNLALFLLLTMGHFALLNFEVVPRHLIASNILFGAWLVFFYSVGLYDIERFATPGTIGRRLLQGLGISGMVTIVFFDTFSSFLMLPETILVMDLPLAAPLLFAWRVLFLRWSSNGTKMQILLCGKKTEINDFHRIMSESSHLGFEISRSFVLWNGENVSPASTILNCLNGNHIDILAISRQLREEPSVRGLFYELLCSGIHVVEISHLSEQLTGKIPVCAINEGWFVENLREFNKRGFETFKRVLDLAAAVLLGILTALIFPLVALAIKLDDPGPILFRQKRVGKGGRLFDVIKFRTMVKDAEREGVQWSAEGDPRITAVGHVLRKTRIDELPQLWNVLKGEMSLVGPRPERPEFVKQLAETIPFYETRHLVEPGLTGWAQINFRYGSSVDDAKEKLQYELYYIKNRSVRLELSILIKTLATVLRFEGR